MSHAIARGLSHVALVSSDMHETVKFWGVPILLRDKQRQAAE